MNYERDDKAFPADAYTVDDYGSGIAWHALGWHTEPDEDTQWSGYEQRTGNVVMVMIGDDRKFSYDPDDIHALEREAYCGECGQIGCGPDGLDRS